MRSLKVRFLAVAAGLFLALGGARAETKIELKGVHLCCGACVTAVGKALKEIEGVKPKCDQKAGIVTIVATDDKTAQKAVDALAAAGFHGDTGNKDITIKDDSGAEKGKAKSVTISGVHNCCPACCKAIKATLKKVDGVKEDTAKPSATTFTVGGDFDVAELVKALNDAGFHVKVKKD